MSTPAENTYLSQSFFSSGEQIGYDGVHHPYSSEKIGFRFESTRPKSSSNPIRKNGTRAYGSYSRGAGFQHTGHGTYVRKNIGTAAGANLRGDVTMWGGFVDGYDPYAEAQTCLNDARMKALAGLSESHTQFNVAAAEARSTMRGISKFAQKAARGLGDVWSGLKTAGSGQSRMAGSKLPITKTDLGQLGEVPPYKWKDIPGDYLGYLYGLRPLADDIANGMDQLGNLAKQDMSYGYSVKSTIKREEPITARADCPVEVYDHFLCDGTLTSIGRVRYDYSFPKWWIEQVPVLTPFSEAWEMTRLSFVLDWILPVGNWVGAMESGQFDPYFTEGFELAVTDFAVRGPFRQENAMNPGIRVDMSNDGWAYRRYSMVRTALNSEQRPTFRTKFPSFRNYLGVNHAAQGLSLLTQMLSSPPNSWKGIKGPR